MKNTHHYIMTAPSPSSEGLIKKSFKLSWLVATHKMRAAISMPWIRTRSVIVQSQYLRRLAIHRHSNGIHSNIMVYYKEWQILKEFTVHGIIEHFLLNGIRTYVHKNTIESSIAYTRAIEMLFSFIRISIHYIVHVNHTTINYFLVHQKKALAKIPKW